MLPTVRISFDEILTYQCMCLECVAVFMLYVHSSEEKIHFRPEKK